MEATKTEACTSAQLNREFRAVENEKSKKDEFHHEKMQEFAIQTEEAFDVQKLSPSHEAEQELGQYELSTYTLVQHLESKLQFQNSEMSSGQSTEPLVE